VSTNDKDKMENRVLETANRLRLIRTNFADESGQARRDCLCEELDKTLATILPAQRDEFLKRLLEQLTIIDSTVQCMQQENEAEGTSTINEPTFRNVDLAIQNLLKLLPALTQEQKLIIDRRLQEAGLRPTAVHNDSIDLGEELKAKLQISGELSANRKDLTELSAILVEFVLKLEPLVWNTWRALSPRSNIRSQGSLMKKIGQFLCKDSDVSYDSVAEDLKVLQKLIAALITAVSRAGGQFAKSYLAKFSPSEIAALVKMEPGGVFVSHEVKCWRKYVELAESMDEDTIDVEIKKGVVDYVESLAKGMGHI